MEDFWLPEISMSIALYRILIVIKNKMPLFLGKLLSNLDYFSIINLNVLFAF